MKFVVGAQLNRDKFGIRLGKVWEKFGITLEKVWNKIWKSLGEVWKNLFKFISQKVLLQKNS